MSINIDIISLILGLLIGLKIGNVITMSWLWVLSPIWGWWVIAFVYNILNRE